ncbi:MAG: radical SAM protein [Oscillospiraceae bacterium]|nr:radical SAM protein [Oscillospiraceae bacterium]
MKTKSNDVKLNNLTVLITDICNRNCAGCVNQGFVNTHKRFMTNEVFNQGLEWAKKHKKTGIIFNGGEPTLHPNLIDFIILAKKFNFCTYLFTNYSQPDVVKKIDASKALDRITISNYDQLDLPTQKHFQTKLTLCTIIWSGRFNTKADFDRFIDENKDNYDSLFFQTLRPSTQWAKNNQFVDWLEELFDVTSDENMFLHNKKRAIIYRGCKIKFNNKETSSIQRHNMNLDGEIHDNYNWQYKK